MAFLPDSRSVRPDWRGAIRLLQGFQAARKEDQPESVIHRGYPVDLYVPAKEPIATALFIPGLGIHGREDARMRRFGQALRAAGLRVLIPDVPSLRALRITADQPEEVKALIASLADDARLVTTDALALMSVSFSSVFVLGAAHAMRLNNRIRAVGLIGGYFDIETVANFLIRSKQSDPYGKLVIARSYLEETGSMASSERMLLDRAIETSAIRNASAVALEALFDQTIEDDEKIYRWLTEPETCRELFERVLQVFDGRWSGFRLPTPFSLETPPVFLLHGREDRVIPVSESQSLARSLAKDGVAHYLCVTDLLAHGNSNISLRRTIEIFKLLKGFAWFLGQVKAKRGGLQ